MREPLTLFCTAVIRVCYRNIGIPAPWAAHGNTAARETPALSFAPSSIKLR